MQRIRIEVPDGGPAIWDGWVIAFFLRTPFPKAAAKVRELFDRWRSLVPAEALKWGYVGASAEAAKPVGPQTLARCAAMLDPVKAGKREITSFSVFGPDEEEPDYLLNVSGFRDPDDDEDGLLETWLPHDFFANPAAAAELACQFAGLLPYSSGYAAPALLSTPGAEDDDSGTVGGLALRHPGYDVPRNDDTQLGLGDLVVGARWLTFLGPRLVEQLGGQAALTAAVPGVTVAPAGSGLMLRAGEEPEIGDVNRRVDTPLLRIVARAVEPVTYFGNSALEPVFANDPDALERWERRFLT